MICHSPRINLVAQRRFKGQADGKNGEEAVLAVARAGKKRHPYHRRRRGGQGVRIHANGTPVLAAIDGGTNACRPLITVPDRHPHAREGHASPTPPRTHSSTPNLP